MKVTRKGHQRRWFRSGQESYAYLSKSSVSESDLDSGRLSVQKYSSLIYAFVYLLGLVHRFPKVVFLKKGNEN